MTEPKFKVGDKPFILTEWEGCRGETFTVTLIKRRRNGTFAYFDNSLNWHEDEFYQDTFDGWWEERELSEIDPGRGDA